MYEKSIYIRFDKVLSDEDQDEFLLAIEDQDLSFGGGMLHNEIEGGLSSPTDDIDQKLRTALDSTYLKKHVKVLTLEEFQWDEEDQQ